MNTTTFSPVKGVLTLFLFFVTIVSSAQVVEFADDFESGTANWILTDLWGLNATNSNSPTNSLTESPVGNYGDLETSFATMANPVDLSTVLDANVSFWAIYDIEGGFDYMYVEASGDGGTSWVNLGTFDGENNLTPWLPYSYSLGGFVGSANVLVRFRFVSDGFVTEDGMYIDDFEITSNSIDNSPPLILHTGPVMHQASLSVQNVTAQIIDISGISLAELTYTVDGGGPQIVSGVNTTADEYLFIVPPLPAGSWVDYWLTAIDASDSLNVAQSDTSSYISGNYLVYDNAQIDFVNSYGPGSPQGYAGAAVAVTLPGMTDLVTSLIRNYTDINRPNDSMLIHVWSDNAGLPGVDLITPFLLFPEATLAEPNRITRVDLRPYASQLSNLSGGVFVGFTVPFGEVWVSQTTPGVAGRTFIDSLGIWAGITDDYHFRAITDTFAGAPVADFTFNVSADPLVAFTDISTSSPTSWAWDFGDGVGTSAVQNPSYTYTANGTYNVCLTTTNGVGSSTTCQFVTITNIVSVANFTASSTNFCQGVCITFTDASANGPLTWDWLFPGGTPATDSVQNPTVCYATPGSYDVTLIVSNGGGSDTLTLTSYLTVTSCPVPVAAFSASDTMICVGDPV
ncbi:MAG: PKD domain-containing protein, partial [Flavobacteriales bacterium]|nr:PKD domain-containing protein [Flavobacteriales bacterium]